MGADRLMDWLGLKPENLFSVTGVAALFLFIVWWLLRELKYERGKREEAETENKEKVKMLQDNQIQMLDVFNETVHAISASTEAHKRNIVLMARNNTLIKEIKDALDTRK